MWFVILALLIVAAYFVYDALRDRRLAESGTTLSTARRVQIGEHSNAGSAQPESRSDSDNLSDNQGQSQTFVNPQDSSVRNSGTAGETGSHTSASATSSTAAAGVAAAGVAVAGIAGAVGGSGRKDPASGGKLHFLDAPIGQKDDLTRIDGIGPVIEGELNTLGIYHYHQIGNFSDSDVDSVNGELEFPGRIERENWISQARKLMTDAQAVSGGRASATTSTAATGNTDIANDSSPTMGTNTSGVPDAGAGVVGAGVSAVAAGAALSGSRAANTSSVDEHDDTDWSLTDADLTGAWNTDLMVEIQERLKVLNTRESDAPRLNISREDYRAIKDDDEERFTREQLSTLLDRLREL